VESLIALSPVFLAETELGKHFLGRHPKVQEIVPIEHVSEPCPIPKAELEFRMAMETS
jgi:hypothetical protein